MTLSQVIRTAGNAQLVSPLSFLEASTPGTGGFIDTPNQRLQIRHILPTVTPGELARVPVDGQRRRRRAAAPRRRQHASWRTTSRSSATRSSTARTGLLLVVEKFPGANTLEVTRGVEEALDELRPGLAGMRIDTARLPARRLHRAGDRQPHARGDRRLSSCWRWCCCALLRSGGRRWCAFAAFAVSLTTAALVLSVTGSTFNALVFAGLAVAVGAVIDDAVDRRRTHAGAGERRGDRRGQPRSCAAAAEMRSPMGYATLIVAARRGARVLHRGRDRLVLRAPRTLLCARGGGVDGGRADRHARRSSLMLLATGRPARTRSPLHARGQGRYGARCSRASSRRPRWVARRRGRRRARRPSR